MKKWLVFCFLCILSLHLWSSDIALITLSVGKKYKKATLAGLVSKQKYCEMHGYDFIVCDQHLDHTRPIPWSKIPLINKILPKYKWIFFSDADSLIMNYAIRLETFIDENYDLIICSDVAYLNTGQFFMKNTHWSYDLLASIYLQEQCIYSGIWEQEGLNQLVAKNPTLMDRIKVAPQRTFNSFWPEWYNYVSYDKEKTFNDVVYQPGDFIVHLSACRDLAYLKTKMWEYYSQ